MREGKGTGEVEIRPPGMDGLVLRDRRPKAGPHLGWARGYEIVDPLGNRVVAVFGSHGEEEAVEALQALSRKH